MYREEIGSRLRRRSLLRVSASSSLLHGKKQRFRTVLTHSLYLVRYLNIIVYGTGWQGYYQTEPTAFNGTDAQKALVIGGSCTFWGKIAINAFVKCLTVFLLFFFGFFFFFFSGVYQLSEPTSNRVASIRRNF